MEIERKWMVNGWPDPAYGLRMTEEYQMRQGYLNVRPTVRIREEAKTGGNTAYVSCLKSQGTIARQEIEIEIPEKTFAEIEEMIGISLIKKTRRTYRLPDGLYLEVNHVDAGLPTEFWYAEVEYGSLEQAQTWDPGSVGLSGYLKEDVSEEPGQSMGAFWEMTRLGCDSAQQ